MVEGLAVALVVGWTTTRGWSPHHSVKCTPDGDKPRWQGRGQITNSFEPKLSISTDYEHL